MCQFLARLVVVHMLLSAAACQQTNDNDLNARRSELVLVYSGVQHELNKLKEICAANATLHSLHVWGSGELEINFKENEGSMSSLPEVDQRNALSVMQANEFPSVHCSRNNLRQNRPIHSVRVFSRARGLGVSGYADGYVFFSDTTPPLTQDYLSTDGVLIDSECKEDCWAAFVASD